MYGTETTNVQFLNQSFIDKVDNGMEKEASVAASAFVRQKLREDGFTRKIMEPQMVTAADLDRGLTDEPQIIIEKEPDSVAASMGFRGRAELRYFKGDRYAVNFSKIESKEFKKSKFELATYRTDIRTVLQENSVKDIQKVEDTSFYANVLAMATAASNVYTISGGFNMVNFQAGVKKLLAKQLPVGKILMTQEMYADFMAQPATQIGSDAASALFMGQTGVATPYGNQIIVTNKNDILPNNQMIVFAPTQYLGQMYIMQDAMVYLKTEADLLSFKTYESVGIGFGNVNGAAVINF
jgi:hypothetical protein